ncbi:hypothetical protein GCO76_04985 [Rickettsia sp. R2]|uniref:hypothetical protein n=1 Tax=Rickettsia koreansis TaxID=2358204 RepID=UPI00397DED27
MEFVSNGYTDTAATGTVALPQGLQVQQVGVQAAAQPAHAQARAEAAIVGNVIVARETVDMLGQRQARLRYGSGSGEGSATSRQRKLKVKASTECTSTNTS